MKLFFALFSIAVIALAVFPFLNQSEKSQSVSGLPWQIDTMPDGSTQVFGLHIGSSTLSDAVDVFGGDVEVAIIAATDEPGNLEMYYGHYRAGLLSGKLVLETHVDQQKIKQWRDNAIMSEYMASGRAKKYILSPEDLTQVLNEAVVGLTFIPVVNLDDDVIIARFGEPSEKIVATDVTHYLYPSKGLVIALHESAKEVIQYVHPRAFERLSHPLR